MEPPAPKSTAAPVAAPRASRRSPDAAPKPRLSTGQPANGEVKKTEEKPPKRKRGNRGKKATGRTQKWTLMEQHFALPSEEAIPRLVVIDGCNVARSASGRSREFVNCLGLLCVVRFLIRRNIDVVIFLPVVYNNQYNFNAKNLHILPVLHKLNILTFTAARASRGDRSAFINYDDLYVLDFAERYGGCVISSDRFDDIRKLKEYGEYQNIIDARRIDVRFKVGEGNEEDRVRGHFPEFFIHGDQLGADAKKMKAAEDHMKHSLFCFPGDEEFLKASTRRKVWSEERKTKILATIDGLLEEMDSNANSDTHLPSMCSDPSAAKHVYKTRCVR
ncbi:hypothetical protein QR680_014968 [Steinernema hermaphroditum]|uniref:RNase NYN domain-containing protein n=1 Tax=Steinernema hermaphroditum TaxID=289476 RepID=A0AA39IAP6_9BILA|nr:hypothetical protein QR680_014968 [Steinernema hermaphroditum]